MAPRKKSNNRQRARSGDASSATVERVALSGPNRPRFPIRSIRGILQQYLPRGTVKLEAAILLAYVLEYLSVEMLEQSANAASSRIGPFRMDDEEPIEVKEEDFSTAVRRNPEIRELLNKVKGLSRRRVR